MKVTLTLIRDVASFLALLLIVFLSGAFRGGDSTQGGGIAQRLGSIFTVKKAHADTPYSESSYYSQGTYWSDPFGGGGFSGECSCESAAQGEGADC